MNSPNTVHAKTVDQADMRSINRSAVLEYLRLVKTASRTEMAERLSISLPSIARITEELIRSGLVRSTGEKQASRGRGRDLLELNAAGNLVIAIDLGGSHISGALVNLAHIASVQPAGLRRTRCLLIFGARCSGTFAAIGVPALMLKNAPPRRPQLPVIADTNISTRLVCVLLVC